MTAPIKNNETPQNDPYGDYGDPYGDYGSEEDPYGDYYGDDTVGMDEYGDEYVGGEEEAGSESAPLTVEYARQHLNDLLELLKVSELSPEEQKEIKAEIAALKAKINTTVGMSPTAQEMALGQLNEKMFELEGRIMGTGEEGEGGSSMKSQIEDTRKKADEYLAQGLITQGTYDKIIQDLDRATALLDIEGEEGEGSAQVQELIDSAKEKLVNGGTSSDKAQKLAEQLNKTPEEVEEAAADAGVDLNAEPLQVDDKLMNMLVALGVPSAEDMSQLTSLQEQWKAQVADWSSKGDAATTEWRGDSERVPDKRIWDELYKLYTKTDPLGTQMTQLKEKMCGQLVEALGALGITASPGSVAGRIVVNGAEMDFVNEDSGAYKLDTVFNELTNPYFSPAPRNTYAEDADGGYNVIWNEVGGDYPKTDFHSGGEFDD